MWPFKKKELVEYRTINGNKLAPYPNMTDEELEDFEKYAEEITGIK